MKQAVPLNRYVAFFAIAIGGCAIDLATKTWMFANLDGRTWWLIDGVFGFQTALNEGALFGVGQGLSFFFAALSIGAAIGIVLWLFGSGAARDWLLTVALAVVTIGILGNLYDRLGLPGLEWDGTYGNHAQGEPVYAVRDFIHVMIGRWPWPTFNLADVALNCGAALLIWHAFFTKAEPAHEEPAVESPEKAG